MIGRTIWSTICTVYQVTWPSFFAASTKAVSAAKTALADAITLKSETSTKATCFIDQLPVRPPPRNADAIPISGQMLRELTRAYTETSVFDLGLPPDVLANLD